MTACTLDGFINRLLLPRFAVMRAQRNSESKTSGDGEVLYHFHVHPNHGATDYYAQTSTHTKLLRPPANRIHLLSCGRGGELLPGMRASQLLH